MIAAALIPTKSSTIRWVAVSKVDLVLRYIPPVKEFKMNSTTSDFGVRVALQAAYDEARVEDDDRAGINEHEGRGVVVELPAAFPYKNGVDETVNLPIRVAWNGGDGIVLEVGPYDFDGRSVTLLQQAIAHFHYYGGEC